MGWNKQSGDAWELQREAVRTLEPGLKVLGLKVTADWLTIEDAHKLALAILDEVYAAAQSEGKQPETREQWKARTFALHYGSEGDFSKAVLDNWNKVLGEYGGEFDYAPQFDEDDGCPND